MITYYYSVYRRDALILNKFFEFESETEKVDNSNKQQIQIQNMSVINTNKNPILNKDCPEFKMRKFMIQKKTLKSNPNFSVKENYINADFIHSNLQQKAKFSKMKFSFCEVAKKIITRWCLRKNLKNK
jgi:hypothetical protein